MEVADNFLSALKCFPVSLLLFKHLIFISSLLFFNQIQSFPYHVVKVLWLLVDCPPVLDLLWFELEHIVLHHYVDFSISVYFCFHFLYLKSDRSLKIILELTDFLNVDSGLLNFSLYFLETFDLFNSRVNYSFRNDLYQSLSYLVILICHIIANLLRFNLEKTNLNLFNDLSSYLLLALPIDFNLILNLFYFLIFIFLYSLQLFTHILKQELFILRVFGKVNEQRISNCLEILLKLIVKFPNP
jgi:hypothetical protein